MTSETELKEIDVDGIIFRIDVNTTPLQKEGDRYIRPDWIDRSVREPGSGETVLWTHFPVCDTTMEFASMDQSDWPEIDRHTFVFVNKGVKEDRPWLTHWRKVDNEFYYIK